MARVIDCECGQQVRADTDQELYLAAREHFVRAHPGSRFTDGDVRGRILESAYTIGSPIDAHAVVLTRRVFKDVWERGDIEAARECFARDYVNHDPAMPEVPPGFIGVLENVATYRTAFPDQRFMLHEILAAGDKVAVRFSVTGTHWGRLGAIPPSGRTVTVTGISLFRIENGKISESWGHWDTLGLLQQVGALTSRGQGAGIRGQ
jgi:steroid delta-isomerase-like uncharacterized protein